MNILHMAPDFDINSGITKYILDLFKYSRNDADIHFSFITNKGNALYRLDQLGIKYEIIPFSNGIKNILYVGQNEKDIKNYCQQNNIDIIHTHHRYLELVANNVKKSITVKTITTAHSMVAGFSKSSYKSDYIIAVSKAVNDRIVDLFKVSKNRVETIYNCVPIPEYIPADVKREKEKLGIKTGDSVFLFVGRGTKLKGADVLIKAFNKIFIKYPSSYLIMIADQFDKSVLKLKLCNNIKIMAPEENISKYYSLADAVVLPSLQDSFPYVMLESGLMKKCFIASKVGGMAEFLDENTALLIPPNDDKLLEQKMEYVINNKTEIDKIGLNLYNKVLPLTNCQEYYSKLKTIYNNLIDKNV